MPGDDEGEAKFVRDNSPAGTLDIGPETLHLPQLAPPPCTPMTLRLSVFAITVHASGDKEAFSAKVHSSTSFTYAGQKYSNNNDKRLPILGNLNRRCTGGLEVLYTGKTALTVDDLPTSLTANTFPGQPMSDLGGRVPVAQFPSKRIITAGIDSILVDGC